MTKTLKDPTNKLLIHKGDTVQVISGNDKGARGRILKAYPKTRHIVVESVNIRKKHQQARQASGSQTQAGIVQFEAKVDVSNVMLVCPKCDKPTRVGIRRDSDVRVRVCKKCGEDID
jgi:large subunit ribosomal protein L24